MFFLAMVRIELRLALWRILGVLFASLGLAQGAAGQLPGLPEAPPELKAYGYSRGLLFLDDKTGTHYLSEFAPYEGASAEPAIVSFHKGTDTSPLVAAESVEVKDPSGNTVPGRRVLPEAVDRFNQLYLPALLRAHGDASRYGRLHQLIYAKGRHFEPTTYYRRQQGQFGTAQEQPLLRLWWERKSGQLLAPLPLSGQPIAIFPLTIAEATQGRAATVGNLNPVAQREKAIETYTANINARDAAAAALARDEIQKARHPGIVHKSSDFWQPFDTMNGARLVFDGAFGELSSEFGSDFVSYVDAFYKVCENYLPAERIRRTVETWDETRVGTRENYQKRVVEMDGRFIDHYNKYVNVHRLTRDGPMLAKLFESLGTRNIEEVNKAIVGVVKETMKPELQMEALLRKATCNSAAVKQLGENFLRAAKGEPSLQRAGIALPGADIESEPVTDADGMWLVMRRRAAELKAALARGDGAPLVSQSLEPFRRGAHADMDKLQANPHLHDLVIRATEEGNLVMRCIYLPPGVQRGDKRREENYTFWYPLGPSTGRAELLAADSSVGALYPGPALTECPATSEAAERLVLSHRASPADSASPVAPKPAQQPKSKPAQASEQTRPVAAPPETGMPVPSAAPPAATLPAPPAQESVIDTKESARDLTSAPASGAPAQSRRPARSEPPAQTDTAVPPNAPSSGAPAAPASKDPVAEAKARAAAMQEVSEAHVRALNEVSKEFQAKMRSAKTPQERKALQDEFRRVQQERQQEFQKKMGELSGR